MDRAERLNQAFKYLRYSGVISTQKDVAIAMNSTPPNISSALKGDEKVLTDNFLIRFADAFEELSSSWLLTGEGTMLVADEPKEYDIETAQEMMRRGVDLIPMYSEPFRAGNEGNDIATSTDHIESYWAIPNVNASRVIPVAGDSMEPTLHRGSAIAVKQFFFRPEEPLSIPFGEVFAITTGDTEDSYTDVVTSYIKRLYKHPDSDKRNTHWIAHSDNPLYEDFEIAIADVTSLWRVKACISYFA